MITIDKQYKNRMVSNMEKKIKNYAKNNPAATPQDIALNFKLHLDEVNEVLKKKTKLSKEDIVSMYRRRTTTTARALAKELGVSYQYIARILKGAGIDFKARTKELKVSADDRLKEQILDMYQNNVFAEKMCQDLGISHTKLNKLTHEMGIELHEMRTRRQEEHIQRLLELRNANVPFKDIAIELGLAENYVINLATRARAEGVPIPNMRDKEE